MPPEAVWMQADPVPFAACPRCGASPFEPFLRGMVGRPTRTLLSWPPYKRRPYIALICWACKQIVGWEEP